MPFTTTSVAKPGLARLLITTSTETCVAWEQRTIWPSEAGAELTGGNLAGNLLCWNSGDMAYEQNNW